MSASSTDVAQALRGSLRLLRAGHCKPDPFILALTVWDGDRPEIALPTTERQRFQTLHAEACRVLDVPVHDADLRPPEQRTFTERAYLMRAYTSSSWAFERAVDHAADLLASHGGLGAAHVAQ